ncbi:hypothetical protein N656DRAFT_684133, partial [Canariomyces notabilis]
PAEFTPYPNVGPPGPRGSFTDSAHFRLYDSPNQAVTTMALSVLEAIYDCFVVDLGWRSAGLSFSANAGDNGPWYKYNIFAVANPGAAGTTSPDIATGLSYIRVSTDYLRGDEFLPAAVFSHEYGHSLTLAERRWNFQGPSLDTWFETLANWFQDLYKTSDLCEPARARHGRRRTETEINLRKNIGDSYQTIVDAVGSTANFYQAWPFLTYLTYNPDRTPGLGTHTVREMVRQFRQGETPLHTLSRLLVAAAANNTNSNNNTTVGDIVARYWARMAYVDIGHPTAQPLFLRTRSTLNFANYGAAGSANSTTWRVKSARAPRYMGANITPLRKTGAVTVTINIIAADAASQAACRATLAVRNISSGAVRYLTLVDGRVSAASVAADEEATLVVANAPTALIVYNPAALQGSPANVGMQYTVTMTGAT